MQTNYLFPDDRVIRMDRLKLIIGYFKKELNGEEQDELDRWVGECDSNMELFEDILEACWPLVEHRR